MQRFSTFLVLALLFFSAKAHCQQPMLGPQPAPSPMPSSFELRVATDLATQNYNLEGTGFTASGSSSEGSGISTDLYWKRASYAIHASYQAFSQEITSPTGLTPVKVDSKYERAVLNYETSAQNNLLYQFGLDYRSRKATETTPNIFMPTQSRTGLRFGFAYGNTVNDIFRFEFGGGLMIPMVVIENSTSTGSYKYSLNPDLNFDFIYKVNPFIDFSLGVHWLLEQTSFAGAGTRGTTDATETFNNFFFPIELRFQF